MRRITFYLSLIMVFTIPWQETVVIPGLGTASRLVGLLAAGFWVLSVLANQKSFRSVRMSKFACVDS